jgi:hypothetical protein
MTSSRRAAAVAAADLCVWSSAVEGAAGKTVTVAKGVRVTLPAGWTVKATVKARFTAEHLKTKKQTEASMIVQAG